ncbi:MAG: hypothetical protein RKR03_15300 [Candidatus Competibacter sp.]|nr:hypothetical protein [Candidatus Competibacter sp.]
MSRAQLGRGISRQPKQATPRQRVRRALGLCGFVGLLLLSLAASGDDLPPSPTGCMPVDATSSQRRYPLNDQAHDLARTESGREFVRYLADCALCPGVAAYADVAGQRHEFPGALGLAPHWLHRPLTEAEQRWVSACILARTNYFGVEVKISLRADHGPHPALAITDDERREFTLHEGDFFGNLFVDPPVAAVALGRATPEQRRDPVFQRRVCTAEDPDAAPLNGKKLSRCRFIITGDARDADAHTLSGQAYAQYISVYLKPQAPSTGPAPP